MIIKNIEKNTEEIKNTKIYFGALPGGTVKKITRPSWWGTQIIDITNNVFSRYFVVG